MKWREENNNVMTQRPPRRRSVVSVSVSVIIKPTILLRKTLYIQETSPMRDNKD